MAELSVIVVSYRTPDLLRRCLQALERHPGRRSREIIVIDNDSRDESPAVAREFSGVRVIETGENLGFAGGANRGLAEAQGRFMIILNPDVEIKPDSLDVLADYLENHPEVGIAAPKLINSDGSLQYSCRRNYTLSTILLRRTFLGRLFPRARPLRRHLMLDYDHETPRAVDWVAGAAMMVRREALDDVGPMDERYFLYFEDVDWCTRMQARGWLVQYVPQSVVVHHWQRASKGSGTAARRHLRSGLRFYDRWGGLVYLWRQNRARWRSAALIGWDLIAIAAAFVIAYLFRQQMAFLLHKPLWSFLSYKGFFAANILVYMAVMAMQGLYREVREGDWIDIFFRVGKAATLGALVLMASTFILDMRGYSRVIVLGSWPLVVAGVFLGRRLFHKFFARAYREKWNLRRVALVGDHRVMDRIEEMMRANSEWGWDPVRLRRVPWLQRPAADAEAQMVRQLSGERVSEVVITPEALPVSEEEIPSTLLFLRRAGFGVRLVSSFLAALPPRARLEAIGDVTWLTLRSPALRPSQLSKRLLDFTASSVLLLLGAVPAALVVLIRRLGGQRILEPKAIWLGRWGEAHPVRPLSGGGWFCAYPLLPKVFLGRFSLVGPRPLKPGETVPGGEAWGRVREHHRPGLVGPWSLAPAHSLDEEMHQELRYLEEWSPETDLKLLARLALKRPQGGTGSGSAPAVSTQQSTRDTAPAGTPRSAHSMGVG